MSEEYQFKDGSALPTPDLSDKMFAIANLTPHSETNFERNEVGLAELFGRVYENETRYCPEAKSWYTYSNGMWVKDIDGLLVHEKMKEFYRLLWLYCLEIDDLQTRTEYAKFVNKMGYRSFREKIMADARSVLMVSATEFDNHPNLINCKNGTFDLKTMSFYEHNRRDFLTMKTNFEYTVQDVKCQRWVDFIDQITVGDKSKATYLQKALGYSLQGTSAEECMFILYGKTTRNGKSTLLDAVQHLLGDYAHGAPTSLICETRIERDPNAPSPVVAKLKGKRFVTMSEVKNNGKLNEETIKAYTGGEEIQARNLHEGVMSFHPQFTLWLSCNELPAVHDKALFNSGRLKVIELNRHFNENEQDKGLKAFFRTEEAMQGIFTWLLSGYCEYKCKGLKMNEEMRAVVKQYEKDNDVILQYLEDKCERVNDEIVTKAKALYDSYKCWCESNKFYPCSAKKFYAGFEQHPEWHGGRVTRDGYPYYRGITIKP